MHHFPIELAAFPKSKAEEGVRASLFKILCFIRQELVSLGLPVSFCVHDTATQGRASFPFWLYVVCLHLAG